MTASDEEVEFWQEYGWWHCTRGPYDLGKPVGVAKDPEEALIDLHDQEDTE